MFSSTDFLMNFSIVTAFSSKNSIFVGDIDSILPRIHVVSVTIPLKSSILTSKYRPSLSN